MKKILAFFTLFLIFTFIPNISAQVPDKTILFEQLISSGDVNVKLEWPEISPDEVSTFYLSFNDPITDELIENTRFDFIVVVMQGEQIIEDYHEARTQTATYQFTVLFPEDSQGPAEVLITLDYIRTDENVLKLDEEISFSVNVIPEFESNDSTSKDDSNTIAKTKTLPDNSENSDSSFILGITLGLVIGVAIGVIIMFIIRQKHEKLLTDHND